MDPIAGELSAALSEQHEELWGLIADLEEGAWQLPSRCPAWTVADVVLHMAQTDEMALASLEDRFGEAALAFAGTGGTPEDAAAVAGNLGPSATIDDSAAWAVARERGEPGAVVAERWRTADAAVRDAFAADDPHRRVPWVSGQLSALSLATTRLAECWIHTGDVAEALGTSQRPANRLRFVARLAWRTLPYAFMREGQELSGPVAFHLRGPGGEAWDFDPDDGEAATVVTGDGFELCLVAARRVEPQKTGLQATGPDAAAVLSLVRTYA
jgi:uncharacterized protein (TIGR03084 family)